jgi:hypothetical protein
LFALTEGLCSVHARRISRPLADEKDDENDLCI